MKSILHPLLLSSAIGLGLALPLAAQEIGRVALSVSDVRGTPPGGAPRPLAIGTGVMADESVETAAAARADILFRDETSLSLGPSTRITLDRFVYDPAAGSGEMAVSLTRGALRFVGGALSEGRPAVVTTPTATIGIRGSSALITTNGAQTTAVFLAGDEMCLATQGNETCTSRIGGVINEEGYQGRVSAAGLDRLLAQVEGPVDAAAPGAGATDMGGLDLGRSVTPSTPPVSTRGRSLDPQAPEQRTEEEEATLSGRRPDPAGGPVPDMPEIPEEEIDPEFPEDPEFPDPEFPEPPPFCTESEECLPPPEFCVEPGYCLPDGPIPGGEFPESPPESETGPF